MNLEMGQYKLIKLKQSEKKNFLNEQIVSDTWNNIKSSNVYVIGVIEERESMTDKFSRNHDQIFLRFDEKHQYTTRNLTNLKWDKY